MITLTIIPTEYGDYDVVAIGYLSELKSLARKESYFDLHKHTKFGCPMLIMDTCQRLKDAKDCIREYNKLITKEKFI